jgi:hypothetical protein
MNFLSEVEMLESMDKRLIRKAYYRQAMAPISWLFILAPAFLLVELGEKKALTKRRRGHQVHSL